MRVPIDTGFDSHQAFIAWVNQGLMEDQPTPRFKEICVLLDWAAGSKEDPREGDLRALYNHVCHLVPEPPVFDPVKGFGKTLGLRARPESRIPLQLLALLMDVGVTRIGKCEECERFFIAHRTTRVQRFCPGKAGKKSRCAIQFNIRKRADRIRRLNNLGEKERERLKEEKRKYHRHYRGRDVDPEYYKSGAHTRYAKRKKDTKQKVEVKRKGGEHAKKR